VCGRFAQFSPVTTLQKVFDIQTVTCSVVPSYNIAPTNKVPAIIFHKGNRLGQFIWSFVPFWAKENSKIPTIINARSETLEDKPTFREAFKDRRCLILADGFYEWEKKVSHKQPWYFTMISGEPFAFAGLWETVKKDDGSVQHSCVIITTAADKSIKEIHHRMPVILKQELHEAWLNPATRDPKKLKEILQDGHVREMNRHPVSPRINKVQNNDPSCIEAIDPT
jgi:putative SOS response-associated peptidase YedK